MRPSQKKRQGLIWSMIGMSLVAYFLYRTVEGEHGWFAMIRMKQEVKAAESTLTRLQKERQELEHRTQLLHPDSMDPDLLEEKSRELLNYSKPNDIVIMTPPAAAKNREKSTP